MRLNAEMIYRSRTAKATIFNVNYIYNMPHWENIFQSKENWKTKLISVIEFGQPLSPNLKKIYI